MMSKCCFSFASHPSTTKTNQTCIYLAEKKDVCYTSLVSTNLPLLPKQIMLRTTKALYHPWVKSTKCATLNIASAEREGTFSGGFSVLRLSY